MKLKMITIECECLTAASMEVPDDAVQVHAVRSDGIWKLCVWTPIHPERVPA